MSSTGPADLQHLGDATASTLWLLHHASDSKVRLRIAAERAGSTAFVSADAAETYVLYRELDYFEQLAEICVDPFHVCAWDPGRPIRSAATSGTPTSARTPQGQVDQGHALVTAQGARAPEHQPTRHPAQGRSGQPAPLPRLSCSERTCGCSTTCPTPAPRPPTSTPGRPGPPAPACPFVRLARTPRAHRDGILAAIRLGLSHGRLEGLNSKSA